MIILFMAGAVLALSQSNIAPPPPPTAAPPQFDRAASSRWERRPTAKEIAANYPRAAYLAHVRGTAEIDCEVGPRGYLEHCAVARESPSGWGFGRAALTLQRDFQLKPETAAGRGMFGAHVRIPLTFSNPR